ncbi:MAG: S-formylglutathione hydrolase [Gammaproteobacteria bacterium]|nr:MAG: S-formylglutathione hydrolase [Gammaproteobacteria bacterium]
MAAFETASEHRCYGGTVGFYRHESDACGAMGFSVFVPPDAKDAPVLFYLAGLTCTEETFMVKAGAQRLASELGMVLVAPDTSPRGTAYKGATDDWDFGEGAGFYLDATEKPWLGRFRMYTYVTEELPKLLVDEFPVDPERMGIFGHSMGGHGALTIALKNPDLYRSVSAFSPIVSPSEVPWGKKALPRYLGDDEEAWAEYDTCRLLESGRTFPDTILVDQGMKDPFLVEQLDPDRFEEACQAAGQKYELRRQDGYDHGYYFVSTFMADHLRHHAERLC